MSVGQSAQQQGQLPVETTGFIGREAELTRLSRLLGQARLVTVTGPAGVGKTRVALRAAAQAGPGFADGVCLVELAALRDPALLVPAVATALGLADPGRGPGEDAVLAALHGRRLLLILDTCEHLVDACAMFAEAVISHAPRVTLLATSREPLDVIGENACPVGPLAVPDLSGPAPGGPADGGARPAGDAATEGFRGTAVELFLQRAEAAVPGFSVTPGDLPALVRLCQRLDGMPLAIELAAVRLRALPLAELASRLDQRLTLLTSGHRGGRHRTLRDAIGWSHDLCTPVERAVWARLSVFAGPFTMSAAEEVCGGDLDPGQVMPTLIRLVDKSLLVRIDPRAGGEPTQYLMLDTFREFGAERLAASDAAVTARTRVIGRYLAMARSFREHFLDHEQLPRLRELRREHANVRAALEYALGDPGDETALAGQAGQAKPAHLDQWAADGVELATALVTYWRARCLVPEGSFELSRAIERAPAGSPARGCALLARGHLLTTLGRAAEALADADEALALAGRLGHEGMAAHAHLVRNGALCAGGRVAEAAQEGAAARRLLAAQGDQLGLISLDAQLAYLALLNEDIETALEYVERGLRQLGGSRERWLHASLYLIASLALYLAGRDIESTWTVTRALQVKQEIGDTLGTAFALEILGWLASRSGSHPRAAWLLGSAGPLWQRTGGLLAATPRLERLRADAVARSQGALGGKRFAELLTRGASQPLDAVVPFALNQADSPADDGGAKAGLPVQLTAREQEIAALVADGLSNRQIAERLFISRRTVDAHLEHIFGKLGITSRVMLTIQLREYPAEPVSDAGV